MQAAQLIQGSPHAANRWQENLSMQLKQMGFIRNNVDHSFYVKFDLNNELEAMLSITVDDLLLSFKMMLYNNNFTKIYPPPLMLQHQPTPHE